MLKRTSKRIELLEALAAMEPEEHFMENRKLDKFAPELKSAYIHFFRKRTAAFPLTEAPIDAARAQTLRNQFYRFREACAKYQVRNAWLLSLLYFNLNGPKGPQLELLYNDERDVYEHFVAFESQKKRTADYEDAQEEIAQREIQRANSAEMLAKTLETIEQAMMQEKAPTPLQGTISGAEGVRAFWKKQGLEGKELEAKVRESIPAPEAVQAVEQKRITLATSVQDLQAELEAELDKMFNDGDDPKESA